jgi:hypothetical protein
MPPADRSPEAFEIPLAPASAGQRVGVRGPYRLELRKQSREDALGIGHDVVVPEAHDAPALRFDEIGAGGVALGRVLPAMAQAKSTT